MVKNNYFKKQYPTVNVSKVKDFLKTGQILNFFKLCTQMVYKSSKLINLEVWFASNFYWKNINQP